MRFCKIFTVFAAIWSGLLPAFLAAGVSTALIVPNAYAMDECRNLNASVVTPPRPDGGAAQSNQDIDFGELLFGPGDRLTIQVQTQGQGGGVIEISGISIGNEQFLGSPRRLVAGVVELIELVNNASSASQGNLEVEITNNVVGASVAVSVRCFANGDNGNDGGNDDAGDGNDNNILGVDANDAQREITGTFTITNPESVNGNVFDVFGVNLSEALFERAIEADRNRRQAAANNQDPQQPAEPEVGVNVLVPGEPIEPAEGQPEPRDNDDPAPPPNRPPQAAELGNVIEENDEENNNDNEDQQDGKDPCAECRRELAQLQEQLAAIERELNETNELVDSFLADAIALVQNNDAFKPPLRDQLANAVDNPELFDQIVNSASQRITDDSFSSDDINLNAPIGVDKEKVAQALRDAIAPDPNVTPELIDAAVAEVRDERQEAAIQTAEREFDNAEDNLREARNELGRLQNSQREASDRIPQLVDRINNIQLQATTADVIGEAVDDVSGVLFGREENPDEGVFINETGFVPVLTDPTVGGSLFAGGTVTVAAVAIAADASTTIGLGLTVGAVISTTGLVAAPIAVAAAVLAFGVITNDGLSREQVREIEDLKLDIRVALREISDAALLISDAEERVENSRQALRDANQNLRNAEALPSGSANPSAEELTAANSFFIRERFERNLIEVFFDTEGGNNLRARARELSDQRFALIEQIEEKQDKLFLCINQQRQSSIKPQTPADSTARVARLSQPAIRLNAATRPTQAIQPLGFQRRYAVANTLPRLSTRPVAASTFGPRYASSGNGFVAASENTLVSQFDLRRWRLLAYERRYAQNTAQNDQSVPGRDAVSPQETLPGILGDERFNLFGSSQISRVDNGLTDQDGLSYALSAGASWLIHPRLNLGIAGRFQDADIDSSISTIDARTWGIAFFAQSRLPLGAQSINLEFITAYSRSDLDSTFDNDVIETTADAETEAFSSQIKASTSFRLDKLSITPFVSFSHVATDQESFLLSDGQPVPGLSNNENILNAGASFSSAFFIPNTKIELSPSLSVSAFGALNSGNGVGVSTSVNLGFKSKKGINGSVGVGFSGLTEDDVRNLSISGNISIPF